MGKQDKDPRDLVEQLNAGKLSRRQFAFRASAIGLSTGAIGSILAACGDGDEAAVTTTTAAAPTTAPTTTAAAATTTAAPEATTTTAAPGGPIRGGRLVTAHTGAGPAETLLPWNEASFIDVGRHKQMYEKLFERDPSLTPQPILAESLEPNAAGDVWQLKLKSGITFHNGKEMTADDVLYSWSEASNVEYESGSNFGVFDLANTRKVSDTEVELHLTQPLADLPAVLAKKVMYIVPDGLSDYDQPVGTGAFTFVEWTPGERSLMARYDDYWGEGKPYVDEVEMISIEDPTARLNALLGGQVDAVEQLDFTQATAHRDNPDVQLIIAESTTTVPLTMRVDTPPFDDPRVREAIKLSVDRDQMVESVLLGFGFVGNDLFGLGWPSYNSQLPQRTYDPDRARALLTEAGHDGLEVTLYTSQVVPGMLESATIFKEQARASGIEVTLEVLPGEAYFDVEQSYLSPSAPFYQSIWGGPFEGQAVDGLLADSPYNETVWNRPDWEEAFRAAQGIIDGNERAAALQELQVPLYEEGGYVIWGFSAIIDAASPRVQGIVPTGVFNLGHYDFKEWWFES